MQGDTQGDTPVQGDTGGYGGTTYAPVPRTCMHCNKVIQFADPLDADALEPATRQSIYDVAVLLYQRRRWGGVSAVEDFATLLGWADYAPCGPCEATTPRIDGACMVCGTSH